MKNMKKLIALVLVAMTVLAVAIPTMAATRATRYITSSNGNTVNVRTGPGTNYPKAPVSEYSVGTKVYTIQTSGSWTKVTDDNNEGGWVMTQFLTSDSTVHDNQAEWEKLYGPGTTSNDSGPSTPRQIAAMQRALISQGCSVGAAGADGYYGSGTQSGVRCFQAKKGLPQTGIANPATKLALYNAINP